MTHNIIRTKIPEHLQPLQLLTFCSYRKYRPEYESAEPFIDLTSAAVDRIPLHRYWGWSSDEIADWIVTETNYPEFKEAFTKSKIDGKSIVLLEADKLPIINIKNFEAIKEITAAIRKCCERDNEEFKRSVGLPIRRPQVLYLWYKCTNRGPTGLATTQSQYYKRINLVRDVGALERQFYSLLNHWNRIPPYRPIIPRATVGGKRRINPMTGTTQRTAERLTDHPYLLKDLCSYFILRKDHIRPRVPMKRIPKPVHEKPKDPCILLNEIQPKNKHK